MRVRFLTCTALCGVVVVVMSSVLDAMKGPIGVAFLTMVTVLLVSKDIVVCCLLSLLLGAHRLWSK